MTTVISFTCQHLTYLEVAVCVFSRINQAEEEGLSVVDVDGSYIYRKCQRLVESGENVTQPNHPGPPPSGWKVVCMSCSLTTTCEQGVSLSHH